MNEKNSAYWRNEIAASSGDSKKLLNVFRTVLGETRTDDTDQHTADEFAVFFRDKIDSVRASTVSTPLSTTFRFVRHRRWSNSLL